MRLIYSDGVNFLLAYTSSGEPIYFELFFIFIFLLSAYVTTNIEVHLPFWYLSGAMIVVVFFHKFTGFIYFEGI